MIGDMLWLTSTVLLNRELAKAKSTSRIIVGLYSPIRSKYLCRGEFDFNHSPHFNAIHTPTTGSLHAMVLPGNGEKKRRIVPNRFYTTDRALAKQQPLFISHTLRKGKPLTRNVLISR